MSGGGEEDVHLRKQLQSFLNKFEAELKCDFKLLNFEFMVSFLLLAFAAL